MNTNILLPQKDSLSKRYAGRASKVTIELVKDLSASETKEQYRLATAKAATGVAGAIYAGSASYGLAAAAGTATGVAAVATVGVAAVLITAGVVAVDAITDQLDVDLKLSIAESEHSKHFAKTYVEKFSLFSEKPATPETFRLLPDEDFSFDIEVHIPSNNIEFVDDFKLKPPKMLREFPEKDGGGFLDSVKEFFGL